MDGERLVLIGVLGCIAAGVATGVGAIPILFIKDISDRLLDGLLGFAAGVMLAATAFSLLMPALDMPQGGVWIVAMGVLVGAAVLTLIDLAVPHFHFLSQRLEGPSTSLRKIWLFVIAITLHNFPEGLAVGVGFGEGVGQADPDIIARAIRNGIILAIAIGLQNMPEGLAVALSLKREGYSRWKCLWYATATGLVEPFMGFLGLLAVSLARPILPFGMAFAGGAMLYVVSHEIIPESHRRGFEREATFGVIIGFVVMMVLDNAFG